MLLRLFHIKDGELSVERDDPYNEGIRYILQSEYGKAIGFFESLEEDSDPVQPKLFKGMAYFLEEKPSYEKAQQCFVAAAHYLIDQRDASEKQGKTPDLENEKLLALAMTGVGYCLFMQGQFRAAFDAFNEALKYDLESVDAHLGNSLVLQLLGYTTAARKCSEAAERLQSDNVFVLNTRGNALLLGGELQNARPYFLAIHAKAQPIDKAMFDKIRKVYEEYTDLENPLYVYPDGGEQDTRAGASWRKARVEPGYKPEAKNAKQNAEELLNLLAERQKRKLLQESKRADHQQNKVAVAKPRAVIAETSVPTMVSVPSQSTLHANKRALQASPLQVHYDHPPEEPTTFTSAVVELKSISEKQLPSVLPDPQPNVSNAVLSDIPLVVSASITTPPIAFSVKVAQGVAIPITETSDLKRSPEPSAPELLQPAPNPVVLGTVESQAVLTLTVRQMIDSDPSFHIFFKAFNFRLVKYRDALSNTAAGMHSLDKKGTDTGLNILAKLADAVSLGLASVVNDVRQERKNRGVKNVANEIGEECFYLPNLTNEFFEEASTRITFKYADQIKQLTLIQKNPESKTEEKKKVSEAPKIPNQSEEPKKSKSMKEKFIAGAKAAKAAVGAALIKFQKKLISAVKIVKDKVTGVVRKVVNSKPPKDGVKSLAKAAATCVVESIERHLKQDLELALQTVQTSVYQHYSSLPNKAESKEPWSDQSIFQHTGIRVALDANTFAHYEADPKYLKDKTQFRKDFVMGVCNQFGVASAGVFSVVFEYEGAPEPEPIYCDGVLNFGYRYGTNADVERMPYLVRSQPEVVCQVEEKFGKPTFTPQQCFDFMEEKYTPSGANSYQIMRALAQSQAANTKLQQYHVALQKQVEEQQNQLKRQQQQMDQIMALLTGPAGSRMQMLSFMSQQGNQVLPQVDGSSLTPTEVAKLA